MDRNFNKYIPALSYVWFTPLYDPLMKRFMRESTFKRYPEILQMARKKVTKASLDIKLDLGLSFELPYPDRSFDRVFSSLVFHHLTTFKEIFRVLSPVGELHVADFGKLQNALMYLISLVFRHLEETRDNINGLLPEMFRKVGFEQVEETARFMTLFGTLSLYRAKKL
ncbi:MAG: methyltransferase domain-containing protein [Candidatus Methanoperedens sp.]|nr:methyltransferase domain-containing protein [Candidatus Methanoperedens sp.]CAG1008724.1 hypothetical protein METP1_03629 [Methanosarcinales archaeon]